MRRATEGTRTGIWRNCARRQRSSQPTSHLWIAAIALGVLLLPMPSQAQASAAPGPVIGHYRAYRAALEQGNLQLAESEAALALAASIEQYGDRGRTGVLAVNLAGVRLTLEQYTAAVEPARRALAIAETQGSTSGVDVRVARLLLGRAELPDGGAAVQDRLMQAISAAQGIPGIEAEAYPAATELAAAAYVAGRYELAREAWRASAAFAAGSSVNADHARAIARTGEAVAAFRQSEPSPKEPPVGTRLVPEEEFALVDALLAEAMDLVHDEALAGERGGELTPAQAAYAQASAWKSALQAKLTSEGRPLKAEATPKKAGVEIGASADPRPVCHGHVVTEPGPKFPPAKQLYERIGAVVLKLLTDDTGRVVRVQIAGTVGGKVFVNAVVDAARQWHFVQDGTAQSGCRMAMELFATVQFVLED